MPNLNKLKITSKHSIPKSYFFDSYSLSKTEHQLECPSYKSLLKYNPNLSPHPIPIPFGQV